MKETHIIQIDARKYLEKLLCEHAYLFNIKQCRCQTSIAENGIPNTTLRVCSVFEWAAHVSKLICPDIKGFETGISNLHFKYE